MSNKDDKTEIFHNYGLYQPRRTVELFGEINLESFTQVWRNLHILDHTEGTINLIINSEGGDLYQAMAIYDIVKGCRNLVRGMVYGEASSSASVVLQSCDERVLSPNSNLMIHVGEESSPSLHPVIKERWDQKNKEVNTWMEDIYLKQIKKVKPRYTRAQLQSILKFDTILSAKQAIAMGLADRIEENFE